MNPGFIFLLLFVGIPVTELYFMIEVGSVIGAISTISLVVFTAVLGGLMVRIQGFSTMMRVREMANRGEMPAVEMMEGVVLLMMKLEFSAIRSGIVSKGAPAFIRESLFS